MESSLFEVTARRWGAPGGGTALIGRDAEVLAGEAALTKGRGVVLAGLRGVGRTRLAREILAVVQQAGVAVDHLVASAAATRVPLGALAGLPGSPSPSTVGDAVAWATGQAEVGRRLLVVDDAHLLDETSAIFVQHVAVRGIATVLLTVCIDEPAPAPVTALWRDEVLPRIDLAPLGPVAIADILEDALGAAVDDVSLERMGWLCHGNLVYLRELVHDAVRDGSLERCGAAWCWRGTVSPGSRLGELVSARLSALEPSEREVLELLAWADTLGARLLQELVPGADLVAMERARLIAVDAADRRRDVRFRSPLDAEVLRALTPRLRADQICRTLAEAVQARGARRPTDRLAIARWKLAAGDGDVDPALCLAAIGSGEQIADPLLTERLARAAVEAAPDSLDAGLVLGAMLAERGHNSEAAQLLSALEGNVRSERAMVRLALARAQTDCWGRGEPAAAVDLLLEAERRIESPEGRQELQAMRASVHFGAGQAVEAVAAAEEVLTTSPTRPGLLRMLRIAVPALAMTGRIQEALTEGERCLDADDSAPFDVRFDLSLAMASALRAASRLDEAHRLAGQVYVDASRRSMGSTVGAAAQMLGLVALDAGRVLDARRWLDEAVALLDLPPASGRGYPHDRVGCLGLARSSLARTLAITSGGGPKGEGPMAAEAAAAQRAAESADHPARRSWAAQVELGRAWVAAADERITESRQLALAAAESAAAKGHHTIALNAAHDALRLGAGRAARPSLESAAEHTTGPLARVCLDHAIAQDSGDGHRLDAVAREFAALGRRLLAAEAATEAARAHRREGSAARASASGATAAGLLATCQGALSPVIGEHGVTTALTPREREVVKLAAAGRSNREIAERLGASVRTVESHLAHVYGKLGITRRDQLADVYR